MNYFELLIGITAITAMLFLHKIMFLISFPGVIMHEFAHKIFCNLFGIKVHKVKYFDLFCTLGSSDLGGYVVHNYPEKAFHQFFISFAPFLINTTLCILLIYPWQLSLYKLSGTFKYIVVIVSFVANWIGISCGMHAFPSNDDLINVNNVCSISKPASYRARFALLFIMALVYIFRLINTLRIHPLVDLAFVLCLILLPLL